MCKKKRRTLLLIFFLLSVLMIAGLYSGLKVQRYTVYADQITVPIRICLIADLHSCRYGKDEQELITAIDAQQPDLLMLAGDIFDDVLPDHNTATLLKAVAEKYPCYYVTGNHEYWSGSSAFFQKMDILDQCGVKRLSGEVETIVCRGETLNICGVDDPDAQLLAELDTVRFEEQLAHVKALSENGHYTLLLSHRPEYFPQYTAQEFDLVLCGHAHGGQWRLPGLLNGLYAPHQGFFPKYAGGQYEEKCTTMVVSRGLARESTRIPRFYNRPELVIIDLM